MKSPSPATMVMTSRQTFRSSKMPFISFPHMMLRMAFTIGIPGIRKNAFVMRMIKKF